MLEVANWITSAAEYALLMRVPLLTGLLLALLPWLVTRRGVSALLLGLFDVTPPSTIAVTLAATSVAGIVVDNSRVIYRHSFDRGMGGLMHQPPDVSWWVWFALTGALCMPVIVFSIWFSNKQIPGDLASRISYAIATLTLDLAAQQLFVNMFKWGSERFGWTTLKLTPSIFGGYSPARDHITATAGFTLALLFYLGLGRYGYTRLGKKRTVPALCSALMVMMLACSALSGLSFFLDLWHLPLLIVLVIWGAITAQSSYSDHYYELADRPVKAAPAPTPIETFRATKEAHNGRIIVVAANGGGIQAAAWTAHVLEQLGRGSTSFKGSLRFISSVSGGSVGSASYTYWLAEGEGNARRPGDAAARSSLDEVAWGLGWPDLVSSLLPWITRGFMGRGRALERAWCANCGTAEHPESVLDQPLSNWNKGVASGDLPAMIMNATIVESGQRLLLGTTRFTEIENCRARVDAFDLHGTTKDVAAVTAARLSASFPYVTPASRSYLTGGRPHVVDGGYYDNYGMSTLVEWVDEALLADTERVAKSLLVIQIHGAPVAKNSSIVKGGDTDRGWFFQIIAPLLTLNTVRGAGQIAHNDLELEQLQDKWFDRGVPIHSVTLEFPTDDAPLSWHLTQNQKEEILAQWDTDADVRRAREQVREFLDGSDSIRCSCRMCVGELTNKGDK